MYSPTVMGMFTRRIKRMEGSIKMQVVTTGSALQVETNLHSTTGVLPWAHLISIEIVETSRQEK
jgi:hypothetical protein